MASSSSNLVNNLSERFDKIKCKYGHDDKKCVTYIIKYQHFNCFLEYTNFKDDLLNTYVYIVTKIINKSLMKNQRNNFLIDTNFLTMKTIKLFYCCENGVSSYEYMNRWEKFNQTSIPGKKDFYSYLNIENTTDADYTHAK